MDIYTEQKMKFSIDGIAFYFHSRVLTFRVSSYIVIFKPEIYSNTSQLLCCKDLKLAINETKKSNFWFWTLVHPISFTNSRVDL